MLAERVLYCYGMGCYGLSSMCWHLSFGRASSSGLRYVSDENTVMDMIHHRKHDLLFIVHITNNIS